MLCFLLLVIPLAISYRIKLHISRRTINAVARMTVQLRIAGIF
nr:ABC transporter permease [Methanosarcina acetivorans]